MRAYGLAAVVLLGALVGCGDNDGGGGGGGAVCTRAASKLRACGLATEGVFAGCDEPMGADEVCASNCYLNASCDTLDAYFCADEETAALTSCLDGCPGEPQFACGGGETVDEDDRCDGFLDCANGADEDSCPTFECASGDESFPANYECDAVEDCSDGSDEANCMSQVFTCDDGTVFPAFYECDGGPADCADGSDEANCPEALVFICE